MTKSDTEQGKPTGSSIGLSMRGSMIQGYLCEYRKYGKCLNMFEQTRRSGTISIYWIVV
jgi:hypothetical protein